MPKQYTQEEKRKIKDELFANVVYFRDKLKDAPGYSFNLTDDQIRSNIDKKFDIYLKAKEYCDITKENESRNNENISKDLPNYLNIFRGSIYSGINEDKYDDFVKQSNTHAKSEHFKQQVIKDILSTNSKEVVDATLDIEKTVDYALNNRMNIECGYQLNAMIGTVGGIHPNENVSSIVKNNKLLCETTFAIMRDNVKFASNPIYFFFDEINPELSEEKTTALLSFTMGTLYQTKNANALDEELRDGLEFLSPSPDIEKFKSIQTTLNEKGYTNLLYLKSADKSKNVVQSLIDNKELKPLDPVEKRKLDEEFNKFEIAAIYDKINSKPEDSLPLTEEEKTKFNQFFEKSEDPNLDVFNLVNKKEATKFTLNNFNYLYEKKFLHIDKNEPVDENSEGKTYKEFKDFIIEKAQEGVDLTNQNNIKPISPSNVLAKDRAIHVSQYGLILFHENLCKSLTLSDARELIAKKDKTHEKENVEKFYKDVALKLKSYKAQGFTDFSANFVPQFFKDYTHEEKINYLNQGLLSIKAPRTPEGFKSELFQEFVSVPKDLNRETLTKYFNDVEKVKPDINNVTIPKNYQYEFPLNLGEKADVYSFSNIIADTKKKFEKEGNKEVLAALKESNEILKEGSDDFNLTNTSEMMGVNSNAIGNFECLEYLKNKDYFDKNDFRISDDGAQFVFNQNASAQRKSQFFKDVDKMTMSLSKESKERALGLYNSITNSKFDYKNAIRTNNSQGVQSWIMPLRSQIEKAIISKDGESLVGLVKQYREFEKEADKFYEQIREHDPSDSMPANLSLARTKSIPQKYRTDIITTSKFNGITTMLYDKYNEGIDFSDFLVDDPLSVYKQMQEDNFKNAITKINNFTKQESLTKLLEDYIYKNEEEEVAEIVEKQEEKFVRLLRASEAMPTFLGHPSGKDFYIKSNFLNISYTNKFEQIKDFTKGFTVDRESVFRNAMRFILVEREDRDFFKINSNANKNLDFDTYEPRPKFNEAEYLRTKSSAQELILRSIETYKHFNVPDNGARAGHIVDCAKDALTYIPEDIKTPSVNEAISLIRSGKVNEISTKLMANLKIEASLQKIKRNGVTKDNVHETFTKLADLEKRYKSRNFISKLFGSNVKKEKALIDSMYQRLNKDTGLSIKDLEKIVEKGRTDNLVEFADSVGTIHRNLEEKEANLEFENRLNSVYQNNTFKRELNSENINENLYENVDENENIKADDDFYYDEELLNENSSENELNLNNNEKRKSIIIEEGRGELNSSFIHLSNEEKMQINSKSKNNTDKKDNLFDKDDLVN